MSKLHRHYCQACGDRGTRWLARRRAWYCVTCYNELEHGTVINANINMSGGTPGRLDEDCGSYRTIAVREMEDGGKS